MTNTEKLKEDYRLLPRHDWTSHQEADWWIEKMNQAVIEERERVDGVIKQTRDKLPEELKNMESEEEERYVLGRIDALDDLRFFIGKPADKE